MASAIIIDALRYWERIRGNRAMPARSDLDPLDIPKLLAHVMLVDVLREPLDFRFRLIGTEVQYIISRNYQGVRFSELPHMTRGNQVWSDYEGVVVTRAPATASVSYVGADQYIRAIRHCLMPLSTDGEHVNMIFAAVEIERAEVP